MEYWQLVVLAFLLLVPFALLVDFHPSRERMSASGRPIEREWLGLRARTSPQIDDDHATVDVEH